MPPLALNWQLTQLLTAKEAAAPRPSERIVVAAKQSPMTERLSGPGHMFCENRNGQQAPLQDNVTLTPGGHRIHSLQRTTPGGTTRRAQYISPLKGDGTVTWTRDDGEDDVEQERFGRRTHALDEVDGQLTAAQRSERARAKRKAGVPAASQAKRSDRKPRDSDAITEEERAWYAAQGSQGHRHEWISM